MTRIGLLGGTFDPPHLGHLHLAETAVSELRLEHVLFAPVGQPPHKQGRAITAAKHRLAMVKLAIANHPLFSVSEADLKRPPPHATATLLPLIRNQHPAADLWLVLGSDSLRDFATWITPEKIIQHCRLAIVARPQAEAVWDELEQAVPGLRQAVDYLPGRPLAITATDIRQRVSQRESIARLVPPAVSSYIQQHRLYLPYS